MENKKNAGLIVLVIVLLICLIGSVGFIIYDKVLNKPEKVVEEKKENKIEDITNTSLVSSLQKQLVSSDNSIGLYFSDKITINDSNNYNFIRFNIKNYLIDNNIKESEYQKFGGTEINNSTTYYIEKNKINDYINNKYNTKSSYDLPITTDLNNSKIFEGIIELVSLDNKYGLVSRAKGGGKNTIATKLIEAKKENDIITIYDKAIVCSDEPGHICTKTEDNNVQESEQISYCNGDLEPTSEEDCEGVNSSLFDMKEYSEFRLNKYIDKLHTFKHTFKKGTDGNYYWISSEIEK